MKPKNEVKMQKWQWNIVKEVLYDYLDEYDHREDVREVLIKVNNQNAVFDDEDEDMGDTCRNGKEWDKCGWCNKITKSII